MSPDVQPENLLSTQEAFVRELVPQLLALSSKSSAHHPVVLLTGPAGSGRTTALETAQQCARYTPNVLVTFTRGGTGGGEDDRLSLLHLLAEIVSRLRMRYLRFGAIPFLRYQLCHDILTAEIDLDTDPDANRTVRKRIRQRVFGRHPQPSPDTANAMEQLATFVQVRPTGLVSGSIWLFSLLKWPLWWLTAWRVKRSFRYLSTFSVASDATACLIQLWKWLKSSRSDPDTVQRAERALCEAFLADLQSFHRRHPRRSNCLLLLDELPTQLDGESLHPGARLLHQLSKLRADHESRVAELSDAAWDARRNDDPDWRKYRAMLKRLRERAPAGAPLTIVASTGEDPASSAEEPDDNLFQTAPPQVAPAEALREWQAWFRPGDRTMPESWYCRTAFEPLTLGDVRLLDTSTSRVRDEVANWLCGFDGASPPLVAGLISALENLDEHQRADVLSPTPSRNSVEELCLGLPENLRDTIHSQLTARCTDGGGDV